VREKMRKLEDKDIVYIDPIRGWHYHRKECWMAGPSAVEYKTMIEMKGALNAPYIPCACVEAYLEGRSIVSKPFGIKKEGNKK